MHPIYRVSLLAFGCLISLPLAAAEYHVSPTGNDANAGTPSAMLRTISEGARRAQPGDTVTVHAGIYRERINPPRGGTSDTTRITYQAAPGEAVVIKGSEAVTGWQYVSNDTWTVTLPNSSFGLNNPFNSLVMGDWCTNNANQHTAAVYLNGDWLIEASSQSPVLQPASGTGKWFASVQGGGALLNVEWLQPYKGTTAGTKVDASYFSRKFGVINGNCSEGGQCVGWIDDGDWTRYNGVDFGSQGADNIKIRAASATIGGVIEVHLDGPTGTLLGSVTVPNTGGWQSWQTFTVNIPTQTGVHDVCLLYRSPNAASATTTIWAQFPGKNPNQELVEVNARPSVFYPDEPGISYITVRGFTLEQAATNWAPPTAEQVGLIGTNWGKGWIIENNTVRYSACSGISLGKYGDRWDNSMTGTGSDGTNDYGLTIQRALANGWNKASTGSHIVRNNHISHCEQAGIVGSLGPVFSTISGNSIHDINVRGFLSGAEMAGIKLHGPIDTQILDNHIHYCVRGIWLDWMAQGTRVSGCLFHDNNATQDLFLEVDHGPILIDHNVFLSGYAIWDSSQGEAYVHNLIAGTINFNPDNNRFTPYMAAHDTAILGTQKVTGGDTRFYNNILVGAASLAGYNNAARPTPMAGNVFLKGATASSRESSPLVLSSFDPAIKLNAGLVGYYLEVAVDPTWATSRTRSLVTTALLGNAQVPNAPFEQPNGSPWTLNADFLGDTHPTNPFPGPFQNAASGTSLWKVSTLGIPPAEPGPQVIERIHVDVEGAQATGTAGEFSGTPATVLGQAGEKWNYVTPTNAAGSATNFKNSANVASAVRLAWTPNHNSFDTGPDAAPYRDLLGDYAYVHNGSGGQATSTWTFSGLSPNGVYNLVIYVANGTKSGSSTNTAGGRWTVNGIPKEAIPDGNASSLAEGKQYVRFDNVRPNNSGQIAIAFGIRSGQSYGEMAGLEIETVGFVTPGSMAMAPSGFNGSSFQLTATGLDQSRRYVLTRSTDLNDGFPTVIGNPFSPAGDTATVSDPAPPADRAFYRIEELP